MADFTEGVLKPYATGNIYDRRKSPSKRPKKPFSLENQEETSDHQSKKPLKDELVIRMPEVSDIADTDPERTHPEQEVGQLVDLTG